MVKFSGGKPQAVAQQPRSVKAVVEKISLPFDLDLNASLKNVRLKGREYAAINAIVGLDSKKLEIKTLDLQDKGGNSLLASGAIGELKTLKDIDMSVQGKTSDARGLLQGLGVKTDSLPQSVKAAEVVSEFKGHEGDLAFALNLRAANGTLDTSGKLTNVLAKPVISDLTLRLRHPNYVELARMFKPDFSSGVDIRKTLDVFANVKQEGKVYAFSAIQAQIGPAAITGDVRADMSSAKPLITAKVQAGDVPLDKILGHDASHKGTRRVTPQKGGAQDVRWSRNAIDTQWMNKFNLDLTGSAQSFSYGPWSFSNAALDVDLNNGVLTITKVSGGMHGGQVNLTGKASSGPNPRDPVSVDGRVSMQNVSLESFVSSFSGSQIVKAKGTISMETNVKTTGLSPAALIFDLEGAGKASGGDLVFEGFDLARLSRTLAQPSSSMTENFTALLDTSMSGGSTKFDTLDSTFTITEGVVNFNKLALVGPDASVNSLGSVNLPLWTIDMESAIQLAEPKDSPPLKAVFKGPLDSPGQTFAKSAMDNYFRGLIGNKVQDAIINKLQDKGGGDTGQVLQGIIGGLTGQPPAPQQQAPEAQQPAAGQETTQPAPQQQPQQKNEIAPEDVFKGVLEGVLGGQ
ncbi:MAG: AsmA family protein [Proteobacteria bacterium]|nr:AsmA family protein [Pseudomonadota bacterium]